MDHRTKLGGSLFEGNGSLNSQERLAHSEVSSQTRDLQVSGKAPPDPSSFLQEDALCPGHFFQKAASFPGVL